MTYAELLANPPHDGTGGYHHWAVRVLTETGPQWRFYIGRSWEEADKKAKTPIDVILVRRIVPITKEHYENAISRQSVDEQRRRVGAGKLVGSIHANPYTRRMA